MAASKHTPNAFMQAALAESKKALPDCLPNPPVGCIIVKEGQILARGFTQAPGLFHAEASAMAQIEGSLADCEVYVTLEPCSFQGRTPSCAKSLVSRHPKKIYISVEDPDPRNQGKGIAILQEAGIEVVVGLKANEVVNFIHPDLNLSENHI